MSLLIVVSHSLYGFAEVAIPQGKNDGVKLGLAGIAVSHWSDHPPAIRLIHWKDVLMFTVTQLMM